MRRSLRSRGTPSSPRADRPHVPRRPTGAAGPASPFFSQRILEDDLVNGEVRHNRFQPPILLAELPELADLGDPETTKSLLPPVERRLADPQLAANLFNRGP